jgi:ABC-type branched-subunit amino acid transport system ATPase component/branched-subunit amino acid ABC-type transport system permease component
MARRPCGRLAILIAMARRPCGRLAIKSSPPKGLRMADLMPFIVIGLTTGAVYGLAAVGLVLTYKTSGVFNFAHGAIATAAAYLFYFLHVQHGVGWPIASAAAITIVGLVLGTALERVARSLAGRPLALQVAATVGLLLMVEAISQLLYDPAITRLVPPFLASGHVRVLGTNVDWAQIITLGFAVVATAALSVFFRHARSGLAMRAVVDNPELLDGAGTSPVATRRLAWILGVLLAAASGVLFSPLLPLDPVALTFLVVAAFGAAAIGAFTSLPLTFAGGLLIGVLASVSTKWFTNGLLAGLPPSLPFVVLFAVLLAFPRRWLAPGGFHVAQRRSPWRPPARFQVGGTALLLAGLAFVPGFAGVHLTSWTMTLAASIVFMSLWLLVRTSGQVSLCHVAFTAIGAAAFGHLTDHGVPWLVALVVAGAIAVPIGAILAVPAIRLGGIYLALATFGFGVLLQGMFYTQDYMFGSTGVGLQLPRPSLSFVDVSGDKGYFYVVLGLAVLAGVAAIAISYGRLGRLLRGLADSSTALETNGVDTNVIRVLVFCISAFMAAVGGALAGVSEQTVSADPYIPLLSLTYFALIVIAGGGPAWGGVLAAAALVLVPSYVSGADVGIVLQLLFGASALAVAMLPEERRHVPARVRGWIDDWFGRRRPAARADAAPAARPRVPAGTLSVDALRVRFGGLVAVDDVTIKALTGRVTGLVGPNGAGKTTTFNACSGLVRASGGSISVDATPVTRRGPSGRARLGLGRTFQTIELFESLTVRENVAVGVEGTQAAANPLRHLAATRREIRLTRHSVDEALELCGLTEVAHVPTADLSTGRRRLVELARCLAGPYRFLLLDEPSSGLDKHETAHFGALIKRVVAERGVGVLLVEHDMSLVLDVCAHIYVLDFGKLVFEGSPAEVAASPVVRAAYLGDTALEQRIATVADV